MAQRHSGIFVAKQLLQIIVVVEIELWIKPAPDGLGAQSTGREPFDNPRLEQKASLSPLATTFVPSNAAPGMGLQRLIVGEGLGDRQRTPPEMNLILSSLLVLTRLR